MRLSHGSMDSTLLRVVFILLIRIPSFCSFVVLPYSVRFLTLPSPSDSSAAVDDESVPVDLKYLEFTDHQYQIDGDPVLLLHGLLGQKRNWSSLGTTLAVQLQRKRRILALDLRNHGDNTHDWRDEMSYTHMANDVIRFMDQKGIEKVVAIGHSMGGKVAKMLALQYPQRISGLVILDIAPVTYDASTDSHWKAVETIIQALSQVNLNDKPGKTKRDLDLELRPMIHDPALRAFALTNVEAVGTNPTATEKTQGTEPISAGTKPMLRWKINLDAIQKQLHVLAGFDHYSIINKNENEMGQDRSIRFHGDTYFILGGQSRFVRGSHIPTIANYFPNYMMTTIKGAGHWVHSEAPDDTLLLLKRYLDR